MDGRCDDTMVMGGRCISQKEGIMKEGDEKIFKSNVKIFQDVMSSKTQKARSDRAMTIPNVSHPFDTKYDNW